MRSCCEREHHLDHAGDARGGLGVPDVRLDRAEPEWLGFVRAAVRGLASPGLSIGSPSCGAGAVAPRRRRRRAARGRRRASAAANYALLGRSVGRGQSLAASVLIDRRATQHREDRVSVGLRRRTVRSSSNIPRLRTSPRHRPRSREGLAATIGGEATLATELDVHGRGRP